MSVRVVLLAAVASLTVAAPASADQFTVTGLGDGGGGCQGTGSGTWSCPTLRAAVLAANELGTDDDSILLATAGTISISNGLPIQAGVTITGLGPRQTTVDASAADDPVFTVSGGVQGVTLANMTVQGGTLGNLSVLPGADVGLAFTRMTAAASGPGIANQGTVTATFTLIDGNPGGGVTNSGATLPATLTLGESTVAANGGNGITSTGNGQNDVSLFQATVGRNAGAGLSFGAGHQPASADTSIVAANATADCAGATLIGTFNVVGSVSCGVDTVQNRVGDPQLAASLSFEGGQTNVLKIPPGSLAADYVTPCFLLTDQRGFSIPSNQPCDAGAYDHDGVDPGFQPPVPEPPVPQPPAPTPTPTPSPEPTPVPNRSVVGDEERGTVKVKLPGTSTFVDLNDVKSLPNGTEIDTRKGAIKLRAVPRPGAPVEEALFYDGLFKLKQSGGITTLTLSEVLDCGKAKGKGKKASAAAKKAKKRKLWGDGKGSFRTQGKYSAATVRGTRWLVEDTCTTTTVTVRQGSVTVEDLVKKKRTVVRAGKKHVARAKK